MAEENKKDERKFYKKKRYTIPAGFLLIFIAVGIWAQKEIAYLIDECNKGSIEKCKELEDTYGSTVYESKEDRSKITNPYFADKFKKLDAIEEAAEKKKAEKKAARIADELAIAEEKALNKELLEEAINFVETGKCPDLKDDINRQLLLFNQFGTYVIDKADADPFYSFPKDPVPYNKKAWKKCFGKPKLIDTYQLGDGRRFKSKTFRYESITTNVEINTIKNYIENIIFFYK